MLTAKASVDTARCRPRRRSAGKPMKTLIRAPAAAASGSATTKGTPLTTATQAPSAAKPNWPRLTWPAQPVSTSSDTATMPKTNASTISDTPDTESSAGAPRTRTISAMAPSRAQLRTWSTDRSSAGTGVSSGATLRSEVSARTGLPRRACRCWSRSRAPITTT